MDNDLKITLDVGALGGTVAMIVGQLPTVAAVLTVAWLAFRLWNEVLVTVQRHRDLKRTRSQD